MPVSDVELNTLAATHDIINLGMLADGERRRRHGTRTTFVRVAVVSADPGGPLHRPAAAGELRIEGPPSSRAGAIERTRQVAAVAGGIPLSGFSLADLEVLAAREAVTLRSLLEELRAAGLELVAAAPIDLLQSARRSIEEVNIAGLTLARVTVIVSRSCLSACSSVAALQRDVAVVRCLRHAAPGQPCTTGCET